jgi:hypothetical protein
MCLPEITILLQLRQPPIPPRRFLKLLRNRHNMLITNVGLVVHQLLSNWHTVVVQPQGDAHARNVTQQIERRIECRKAQTQRRQS